MNEKGMMPVSLREIQRILGRSTAAILILQDGGLRKEGTGEESGLEYGSWYHDHTPVIALLFHQYT